MSKSSRFTVTRPLPVFGLTLSGQFISMLGSGLTSFALGLELYEKSGAVTVFALLTFFHYLPMAVLSPVAGALVDRWDRRSAVLLSDLGAGASTALIWALVYLSERGWPIEVWHYYVPVCLGASFGALRWPAYVATTALLIPRQHLARANGMLELALSAGQIFAPVLATVLMTRIGLRGVILVDLVSFLLAVGSLLLVRFPRPPPSTASEDQAKSLWGEVAYGWRFIRERPALLGMLLFILVSNLVTALLSILLTPLVKSFADDITLGRVISFSGLGAVAGGVVMGVWGGPRRRIHGVAGFHLLGGLVLLLACLPPSTLLIASSAAFYLFTTTLMVSCLQAIWQSKVAPELHGRIFAVRRMVGLLALPLAGLLAGPLVDRVFEPWMREGGALAGSLGRVMGTGPGRGIALLFGLMGLVAVTNALFVWLYPRVRRAEEELPDALPSPAGGPP